MLSKARQKEIMEKIDRAQKFSILGPQKLGGLDSYPPWIRYCKPFEIHLYTHISDYYDVKGNE